MSFKVRDLPVPYWRIVGDIERELGEPYSILESDKEGFTFCTETFLDRLTLKPYKKGVFIVPYLPSTVNLFSVARQGVTYVFSNDPKVLFSETLAYLVKTGEVTKREISIGYNVKIHPSAIIGVDGFGAEKNKKGEYMRFPQVGGLIIEDNVEIGANVVVNRGALGDTKISKGTLIAHGTVIGHNCQIGDNVFISPNATLSGGSKIGDSCFIGAGTIINPKVRIAKRTVVGSGSVVRRSFEQGSVLIVGDPATIKRKVKTGQCLKGLPKL